MAMQQLPLPGEIVKKSNALARARWSAESVWEPRLVALLASKVRTDDSDFHVYEIHVSEILRGTGGRDYREIEAVVDRVMSRVLTIRDPKGWTKYNVFSRCRYRREEGILELGFHPDLKPHYLNLQKHFAEFNLIEYLMLPSIYSQRIFEILKSWDDKPEAILSVAELHEMLNTPESFRKNFAAFRRFVLEKAYKDILAHTKLHFEWEPVKKGRSYISVRFTFGRRLAIGAASSSQNQAEKKAQEKRSAANDKAFKAFAACLKERGAACEGGHQKTTVCELCRRFR
jgi:plasmid replication initiation protein